MRKLSVVLIVGAALPLISQTIRVTVDLVQVDAVVTDDQGRHVADLKTADFQILQDGKPQQITHFSYEHSDATPFTALQHSPAAGSTLPDIPTKPIARDQVRRSIVLMVDDLGLSADDIPRVRATAKNFIDRQMQPGDLASVMTASGGIGVLEQFTNDKRLLNASVDRIHFSAGRNGLTWYDPVHQTQPGASGADPAWRLGAAARRNSLTLDSLSSLLYAIDGLKEMPGRKAVAFISDGFFGDVSGLIERANRASVVLYTFDARGLQTFNLSAIDSVYADRTALNIGSFEVARQRDFVAAQHAMALLARGTGGTFFHDNNGLSEALGRALDDMGSYYLIGYQPHQEAFVRVKGVAQFHRIEVKILRPGLRIRSRNGFFGVPEAQTSPVPDTPREQLHRALFSPFHASQLPVQLSAFYSAGDPDRKTGHRPIFLRAMLTIDAHTLQFADTTEGKKKLALDVIAAAYSDRNELVASNGKTFISDLTPDAMNGIVASGLLYSLEIDIPRPGPYQVRIAVRDNNSERTGSASYFLRIPDFREKHIALSSVLLHDDDAGGAGNAVTRSFSQGSALTYECNVFGAALDRATSKPKIEFEVHLFHGEEHIYTGHPIAVAVPDGSASSIRVTGQIKLPPMLPPGDYVAELVARDRLETGKERNAAQWVDFKIYAR